jgi:hypothetical protein
MEFVEVLRIRRALLWHVGIIGAIVLLVISVGGHNASVDINGSTRLMSGMHLPLSFLAVFATFVGAIFASSAGTSLNRENATRELSWTTPLARTLLALRFMLIDMCGIAIAFAAAVLAVVIVLLRMHIVPFADAEAVPELVLGLGIGMMWYALIQAITCTLPQGARALSGAMWPIAFMVGALTHVPGATGALARAVNVLDPLSYVSAASPVAAQAYAVPPMPAETRALLVWGFTVAFLAVAAAIWPKAEA